MISDNCYERQKARQRERYASDPGFRLKQKLYHEKRNKAIKEDPERLSMEKERRRLYYQKNKEQRKQYQRDYIARKRNGA